MINKRNRDTLLVKYGLNRPFLVGSKRGKYCVFVHNAKTKRLNTVYFDKFDIERGKKATAKKAGRSSTKSIMGVSSSKGKAITPLKNRSLNIEVKITPTKVLKKEFWAEQFSNGKFTMKTAKNLKQYKIHKGKFKKLK